MPSTAQSSSGTVNLHIISSHLSTITTKSRRSTVESINDRPVSGVA